MKSAVKRYYKNECTGLVRGVLSVNVKYKGANLQQSLFQRA